eukprot:gnl/MRDRNA2_/MRDRNA2_67683_c0_seq2.p1 gnl/MRDRNA2_/MRDRNA2_67683_c0~~gnl/MRDRNA2_/MRDRNA2_67683_c0_seq2.p1  ORF type:complete len:812 (+),score=206.44 gnl/MRDRNA2_/MRDRNA2_67683_c0_seq2:202-2436(+)
MSLTSMAMTEPTDSGLDMEALKNAKTAAVEGMDIGPLAKTLPLSMIVGNEEVKQALVLAAVNLDMGGVIIAGSKGTAKSVMAKALYRLVPPIERIKGSVYNIDPQGELGVDSFLKDQLEAEGKTVADLEKEVIPCPFVQVPLNTLEDRMLGSVDVEASVKKGRTVFEPGLLASAHRGILFIDDLHLLDDELINILLTIISDGVVNVEREGISVRYPCKPILVATFNPEEGEVRDHILDRFAVSLNVDSVPLTFEQRIEATQGVLKFGSRKEADPTTDKIGLKDADGNELSYQEMLDREEEIKFSLVVAREALKETKMTTEQVRYICNEASRAGCQGQRGELFAYQVARASAALQGRPVEADDLQTGVKLAILPRSTFVQDPTEEQQQQPPPPPPPPPPSNEDQAEGEEENEEETEDEKEDEKEDEEEAEQPPPEVPQEFMFDSDGTVVDADLLAFATKQRSGKSGGRGLIFSQERGRYIKPMLPRGKVKRLAVDATMRAAAPFQRYRREAAKGTKKEGRGVFIEDTDVRIKRMARKAGSLIIFVVDASGSMALNRMNAAKGAAMSLLEEAYQTRDSVALIPFQGEAAEVLLPPTKSIAMATKRLQSMPCGGGSPMAHAINMAVRTGVNAMKTGDIGKCVIVLITDGNANVPLKVSVGEATEEEKKEKVDREAIKEEVFDTVKQLKAFGGFSLLVLDTEANKFVSSGIAKDIAEVGGGRYYLLPKADAKQVGSFVSNAVKEASGG